jgi:hypothetical protein
VTGTVSQWHSLSRPTDRVPVTVARWHRRRRCQSTFGVGISRRQVRRKQTVGSYDVRTVPDHPGCARCGRPGWSLKSSSSPSCAASIFGQASRADSACGRSRLRDRPSSTTSRLAETASATVASSIRQAGLPFCIMSNDVVCMH